MSQITLPSRGVVNIPAPLLTMLESNRLVHAVLLEGGGEQVVDNINTIISGSVMCEKQQGLLCCECTACKKILAGVHYDVTVLGDEDGSYKKDMVRKIRSTLYHAPHEGRAKVYILKNAEEMTAEVQNLMLKAIEEPPPNTYFVISVQNKQLLLGTILSRVALLRVASETLKECIENLGEEYDIADRTLVAILTHNSTQSAQRILASSSDLSLCKTAQTVFDAMEENAYAMIKALVPAEKNRKDYKKMLDYLSLLIEHNRQVISMKKLARISSAIATAKEKSDSNGYLSLISACLVDDIFNK